MSKSFHYGMFKMFRPRNEIANLWAKVREATVLGKLGYSASVTTFKKAYEHCESGNNLHTITILMYSKCSKDVESDISGVRRRLAKLGINEEPVYIPSGKNEARCTPVPEILVSLISPPRKTISKIGIHDDDDHTINFSLYNADKRRATFDTLVCNNNDFLNPSTRHVNKRYLSRMDYLLNNQSPQSHQMQARHRTLWGHNSGEQLQEYYFSDHKRH